MNISTEIYNLFDEEKDLQPCASVPLKYIEAIDFSLIQPAEYRTLMVSGGFTLEDETGKIIGAGDTIKEAYADALYERLQDDSNGLVYKFLSNGIKSGNLEFLIYNDNHTWND